MVIVEIGSNRRTLSEVRPSWINRQINRRAHDGGGACVRIKIKDGDVNLALTTDHCSSNGGGGGRTPNRKEQELFDLWNKHGLNGRDFTGGNLNAFLKQVQRLL